MHSLGGPCVWVCVEWSGSGEGWSVFSQELACRLGPQTLPGVEISPVLGSMGVGLEPQKPACRCDLPVGWVGSLGL